MAEIFEKKHEKTPMKKYKKAPRIRKNQNFENRANLSWPKVGLEQKYHEPGTFGGFGKREQTDRQDSCFISILAVSPRRAGGGSKTEQNERYGFASFSDLNV